MKDFSDVKGLFSSCSTPELRYQKIIELGRSLPPMAETFKIDENIVQGCQSIVYLHSEFKDGKVFFSAASDALISAGLAAILIRAYSGEPPETIVKCLPTFLQELQIFSSLSPGRSNGLGSMFTRMQQSALKYLLPVS